MERFGRQTATEVRGVFKKKSVLPYHSLSRRAGPESKLSSYSSFHGTKIQAVSRDES